MQIFKNPAATKYRSPKLKKSFDEVRTSLSTTVPFAPYEILGESINPAVANSPAVLQGTFLQVTNLDTENATSIILGFGSAEAFVKSSGNVALGANFIDGTGNIHDFTDDFLEVPFLSVEIPSLQTFIVGVQYYFDPSSTSGTPVSATQEAMASRGYVVILPFRGAGFLVTATIRQAFVSSLTTSTPMVISTSAYSVPLSMGPIVQAIDSTDGLLA